MTMTKPNPSSNYMNNNPLCLNLIPTFNRAKYLGAALDSALAQTYPNIEIIVTTTPATDALLHY